MIGYCLVGGLLCAPSLHAGLTFTVENAGVQATTVPGAITETFDSRPLGNLTAPLVTPVGTFSGGVIAPADVYGGAGGTGSYYAVGIEGGGLSATLTLPTAENYLGFWWSAGDSENSFKVYDGATLLASAVCHKRFY